MILPFLHFIYNALRANSNLCAKIPKRLLMLTTSKSYYMKLPFVKNGPKLHNAKKVVLHSTYVTVKVGNLERRNQIVVTVGRRI